MEVGLVVLWIVAFCLLGLAALPFSAWLLSETEPVAFSIPLALAVVGVVAHLVGQVAFGWPAVLAGLAVLLGLSGVAVRRTHIDIEYVTLAEYLVVFVVGFSLVVVIRAIDPAAAPLPLSAGEKFLDFGLLNTLDRSSSLPPESMWFAGEPMQYYYGGQLLASLLATMTGTSTAYAYNLALAGFYATLLVAAYGLAAAIAGPYDVSRRTAGVLGAFFVGLASNLDTAIRLLAWLLPDSLAGSLVTSVGMDPSVADWSPGQFWYWDASRIIPVEPGNPDVEFEAATEFPLFAWLNGDLHAHMISQPFMLLAAAILLAAWRAPLLRRRLLVAVFLPPLVGLIGFLNLWSLPTVLGMTFLGLFFMPDRPVQLLPAQIRTRILDETPDSPIREELSRAFFALLVAAAALLGGLVWTLPFWTTIVPGSPSQSVQYWEPWTPLGPMVVLFGAFFTTFLAYLARGIWLRTDLVYPPVVFAGAIAVVSLSAVLGRAALGVAVPLVLVGWWLLRDGEVGFEVLLLVAGAGILLLVEFVTIEGERFNVIFKPYAQIWLFWAIATAVALPRLAAGWPAIEGVDTTRLRQTGTILAVVLVLATVPYAGFALQEHVTSGTETTDELGTTLDATAYLEVHYPEEAPAIRWLEGRAGQPTILTAAPASYTWDSSEGNGAAAPSSLTGIPTVAGWSHEEQYRGDVYNDRVLDVWTMYGGDPDRQRHLLAEYEVQYVYVGPAELNAGQFDVTVDELDAVSVAESWDGVTIYEVDQEQLAE